jgi:hypothetical protein
MFRVLQNPPSRLRVKQRAEQAKWPHQRSFRLGAMTDAVETPIAEVLAVIGQQAIIILAEARAGTSDDFFGRKYTFRVMDDSHLAPGGESRQGDILNRTALPECGEARVVHDSPAADIHAMMGISSARSRQMGTERQLLLPCRRGTRLGTRGARARIVETIVIHLSISWSLGDGSTATSLQFRDPLVTAEFRDPQGAFHLYWRRVAVCGRIIGGTPQLRR